MIISVTSSKGGSGKTTLNAILGSNLYFSYAKKVWFVDLDPQSSLRKKRQLEIKNFREKKYAVNSEMYMSARKNKERYGEAFCDLTYIDTANHTFEEIKRFILSEQKAKNYDLVILDFPGSLTINATTYRLVSLLDFVFIPMYVDYNTYISSRDFYVFVEKQRLEGKFKCVPYMFYNRFTSGKGVVNAKNFEVLSDFLDGMGVRRLKHNVGHSVEFESFSTFKPTSNRKVSLWIDEIAEILQSASDGTYQIPMPIPKQKEKTTEIPIKENEKESVSESQLKETLKEGEEETEVQNEDEIVETSNPIGEESEKLSSDDLNENESENSSSIEENDFTANENM